MLRAAIALYPTALASSVTLPMEILHAADNLAVARQRKSPRLQLDLVADEHKQLSTSAGLRLVPTSSYEKLREVDLLILPGMWRKPLPTVGAERKLRALIEDLASRDAQICAVGTASYFLAESGLLDGRVATTHWYYFDDFARRYPEVELKTKHLITQSGNFYCAGSVNSIADLAVHLVQSWLGADIARAVESQFSPEIRRPFEAHAYLAEGTSSQPDELVIRAQEWLLGHTGHSVKISDLATELDMSVRSLHRRFQHATGTTPLKFLTRHRMASARDMLRTTDLSVGEIAVHVGYNDHSHFSELFERHYGQHPGAYRRSVRGKLFSIQ